MPDFIEKNYQFELFSYWRSSASWRVRIVLALKSIPYDYKAVDLSTRQQKTPEFQDINPSALIPALRVHHNGELMDTLTQSLAIIEFLDNYRPSGSKIIPSDPFARAHVMEIALCICCDIQPVQSVRVLQTYPNYTDADRTARGRQVITDGFRAVEALIHRRRKQSSELALYCFGNSVTLADVVLIPQVYNALRWGVDMSEFPHIQSIDAHLSQLPAFKAAHADFQPDTPIQFV